MLDMDYLINGLEELYGDESKLTPSGMSVWYEKLIGVLKNIESELPKYDIPSQMRITSALQSTILKSQFSCMCVYSHYKAYPGLVDCLVGTDKRMRLLASDAPITTFYELFYKENMDNNMSGTLNRLYKYVKFLIECALEDVFKSENTEHCKRLARRIARAQSDGTSYVKECMDKIDDMLMFDLMEYVDGDYIVKLMDELCVHDYEKMISKHNDTLEKINEHIKNSAKAEMILASRNANGVVNTLANKLDWNTAERDALLSQLHVKPYIYCYIRDVQQCTKGLTDEEVRKYTEEYYQSLVDVSNISILNRYVEQLLLDNKDAFCFNIHNDDIKTAYEWFTDLVRMWIMLTGRLL